MKKQSLSSKTTREIKNPVPIKEPYGCSVYLFIILVAFVFFNAIGFFIDFDKFKGSFYGIESDKYFIMDDDIFPPHRLVEKSKNRRFFKENSYFGYVNLKTGEKRFYNKLTNSWVDKLPVSNSFSDKIESQEKEIKNNKIVQQKAIPISKQSKKPKEGDRRRVICPTCEGGKAIKCDRCLGKGVILGNNRYGDYGEIYCPNCAGEGRKKCGRCAGEGKITEEYSEATGWFFCMKCEIEQALRNMPIRGGS